MGDPCAAVKLSEVFSACYSEQYDDYLRVPNPATYLKIVFRVWLCSVLQAL